MLLTIASREIRPKLSLLIATAVHFVAFNAERLLSVTRKLPRNSATPPTRMSDRARELTTQAAMLVVVVYRCPATTIERRTAINLTHGLACGDIRACGSHFLKLMIAG